MEDFAGKDSRYKTFYKDFLNGVRNALRSNETAEELVKLFEIIKSWGKIEFFLIILIKSGIGPQEKFLDKGGWKLINLWLLRAYEKKKTVEEKAKMVRILILILDLIDRYSMTMERKVAVNGMIIEELSKSDDVRVRHFAKNILKKVYKKKGRNQAVGSDELNRAPPRVPPPRIISGCKSSQQGTSTRWSFNDDNAMNDVENRGTRSQSGSIEGRQRPSEGVGRPIKRQRTIRNQTVIGEVNQVASSDANPNSDTTPGLDEASSNMAQPPASNSHPNETAASLIIVLPTNLASDPVAGDRSSNVPQSFISISRVSENSATSEATQAPNPASNPIDRGACSDETQASTMASDLAGNEAPPNVAQPVPSTSRASENSATSEATQAPNAASSPIDKGGCSDGTQASTSASDLAGDKAPLNMAQPLPSNSRASEDSATSNADQDPGLTSSPQILDQIFDSHDNATLIDLLPHLFRDVNHLTLKFGIIAGRLSMERSIEYSRQ